MKRFRILSDLHIDVNKFVPIELENKDVFTVICGDTSGTPQKTIEWIKANVHNGVGCSGNHLPYDEQMLTIQERRDMLADAFPTSNSFTYLDCECKDFFKIVDGNLFIGTCMYSDFSIKHKDWNPTGDRQQNMDSAAWHMNDYKYGIVKKTYSLGPDNSPSLTYMKPEDCFKWFCNAYERIEAKLNENEASENPLPVVLFTHFNLVTYFLTRNYYLEDVNHIWRPTDFNWASYASEHEKFLKRHTSIKAYVCGHVHDVEEKHRSFKMKRDDGSEILVANCARGYCRSGHDLMWNPNTFINTETWELEQDPLSDEEKKARDERRSQMMKNLAWLM